MPTQYRIIEQPQFEKKSIYLAQYTRKFLGLFTYWSYYNVTHYGDPYPREFETIEEAKDYITNDAKFDRWYANKKDRVVAVYQLSSDGQLEEVK